MVEKHGRGIPTSTYYKIRDSSKLEKDRGNLEVTAPGCYKDVECEL